jgi:hypothetical protein
MVARSVSQHLEPRKIVRKSRLLDPIVLGFGRLCQNKK